MFFVWVLIACALSFAAAAPPTSLAQADTSAQHLDPESLRAAFDAIEPGIRSLSGEVIPANLPPFDGTSVTIRYAGQIVGRAWSMTPNTRGLEDATTAATTEAFQTLARDFPLPRDRLALALGPALAIDLELATDRRPITLTTYLEASQRLSPGVEGLVFHASTSGPTEAVFPGAMLTASQEPSTALRGAIERALGRPGQGRAPLAETLAELPGARLERFRVLQIAQTRPADPPAVLYRATRWRHDTPPTTPDLQAAANAIATRAASWPDALDTYNPVAHLAAPARGIRADRLAVIRWLANDAFHNTQGLDHDAWPRIERPALAIDRLLADDSQANTALGLLLERAPPAKLGAHAREQGLNALAASLPWLGFAAINASEQDPPVAQPPPHPHAQTTDAPVPLLPIWLEHRQLVDLYTLNTDDLPDDAKDLVGGIVFSAAANPLPDARSAGVVAWQARCLREPSIVPAGSHDHAASRHLMRLAFLLQHLVTEPEAHAHAKPDLSIGGVRRTLWLPEISAETTYLTLIATCHTLQSLNPS